MKNDGSEDTSSVRCPQRNSAVVKRVFLVFQFTEISGTDPRSALRHTAVPSPPRLGQTGHLVGFLALLFPALVFPSGVLVGAVVLQAGQDGRVKHLFEILLGEGGTFHVGQGSDLCRALAGVCRVHGPLVVLRQVDQNLREGDDNSLNSVRKKLSAVGETKDL